MSKFHFRPYGKKDERKKRELFLHIKALRRKNMTHGPYCMFGVGGGGWLAQLLTLKNNFWAQLVLKWAK